MYSMWKIMCFFYLKPHKHIALHQIMLFLATSYDPFNGALHCTALLNKYILVEAELEYPT